MKQNIIETFLGFIIIAIAIFFFSYSYHVQKADIQEEYQLKATFQSVEGIIKGSDVMLAGIIVGKVVDLKLDPETYNAKVTISVDKDVKIPADSRAAVVSNGFLGGKFISIIPGAEEVFLKETDEIKYTQSSINLEALIGKFMYSSNSNGNK